MSLRPGARIWIPCEVKPGPFSDERMVRVQSQAGEWLGFVGLGPAVIPSRTWRAGWLHGSVFRSSPSSRR